MDPHIQDWTNVTFRKKPRPKQGTALQLPEGAARERELHSSEPPVPERVSLQLRKKIQQARLSKKMNQRELANRLNVHPSVVNNIEAGTAIHEKKLIRQIENVLGIKF